MSAMVNLTEIFLSWYTLIDMRQYGINMDVAKLAMPPRIQFGLVNHYTLITSSKMEKKKLYMS